MERKEYWNNLFLKKYGISINIYSFSKHKIDKLKHDLLELKKEKYVRNRTRYLIGSKAAPHRLYEEVQQHFDKLAIEKEKWAKMSLAVHFAAYEGARESDLITLQVDDIDFDEHLCHLYNHKEERWYQVPLYPEVEVHLKAFIGAHEDKIKEHHNFVFYSDAVRLGGDHITEAGIRNQFYLALKELNLRKIYHVSKNGKQWSQYSFHSLRGHAATWIKKKTGDPYLAEKLLDHKSLEVTELYFEDTENDLFKAVRS